MSSDPLTTVLRDTGVSRRLLDLSELSETKALRFPCERSIGLHVVLRGPVHVHAPTLPVTASRSSPTRRGPVHVHAPTLPEPLRLDSGDIAIMARGCDHLLSARAALAGLEVERIDVRTPIRGNRAPGGSAVLSGAYQFWHAPLHPFFAEMPNWSVLRAAELPRLGPLALAGGLLSEELAGAEPGADIVMHGLLDVMFTYALRQVIARCAAAHAGWSQAMGDPQIGRVVALMHDDPAHPWTLDKLARSAGLSRTALAERFRGAMGDTPLNHLRTVRMQRAVKLLAETNRHLEAVAMAVGYQDAFSFSKVFKRTVGTSPKAFRQKDAAERHDPWRFQAG